MRITGLATGLDMDSIIKESMKPYRIKIQTQQQQKEIIEIKQKLYREVIKDSREFYNKYFDVTKSDSLLLSKNWGTTKFTSSNDLAVSVTGLPGAKGGTYTIEGTKATAAKTEITTGIVEGGKIVVNEREFTFRGKDETEIAKNLNSDLQKAGIKIDAKYSNFTASGSGTGVLVLESKVLGVEGKFTVGGVAQVGVGAQGTDATSAKITGFTIEDLKNNGGVIKIGDPAIEITVDTSKDDATIIAELNTKLTDIKAEVTDGKITFTSTKDGSIADPKIVIGEKIGAFVDGKEATKGFMNIAKEDLVNGITLTYGDNKSIILSAVDLADSTKLTTALNGTGLVGNFDADGNLKIESLNPGAAEEYPQSATKTTGTTAIEYIGTDANITITDKSNGSKYIHTGSTNTITVDNIQFTINDIPTGETLTVTGKNDVTGIKDKLVGFVNDYNKLMEKLNTLTMEKKNNSFKPLTDEQKKEMSEDEIKLWNEKVEKGQLSRDSDITRIASSMKSAMSTLVNGADGNLEKFGIRPVADYQGTLNGTFTIDEAKLTEALENDLDDVMKMFIGTPDASVEESQKYVNSGIAQRLKTVLYDETVTVKSSLLKKAGIEGSVTAVNNELTKSIERYDKKMKDLEIDFSRKEQALYSKWARVESMMNSLNSQQSYLASQLGGM